MAITKIMASIKYSNITTIFIILIQNENLNFIIIVTVSAILTGTLVSNNKQCICPKFS